MFPRSSGGLLPIPCLPSGFGIGDLGPYSYRLADYLYSAGQRVWQILPLNPTSPTYRHSPYHSASSLEKRRLELILGREPALDELHWDMIRLAMLSLARMCIIPVQDLLGLGSEARINCPGRYEGNWLWRMSPGQFAALPQKRLRELTEAVGRL